MNDFHRKQVATVLRDLEVEPAAGLSESEATRRLQKYGRNEFLEHGGRNAWRILLEQMTGSVVIMLLIAAVISALLADYKDAVTIAAILLLNAALGFSQEYRTQKAITALKKLAVPHVKVRRQGQASTISAVLLVRGDLVLLEAGDAVPADCRIIESVGLRTMESALTGESEPVDKIAGSLDQPDLALGDRRNMVYLGTFVTAGRGLAAVVETGMKTELGKIASMLQSVVPEPTPLQRRLEHVGNVLAVAALVLVGIIFVQGLLRGEGLRLMFLTAVSVGVAAVPEGLPAVVSISLALGANRMLKRKALIRKLPAVETLGSITTICSDKTGTLTENRMQVVALEVAGDSIVLKPGDSRDRDAILGISGVPLLMVAGTLCNDAHMRAGATPMGDPTEVALLTAANDLGFSKLDLNAAMPRVGEISFSSERKRMTTIHQMTRDLSAVPQEIGSAFRENPGGYVAFTKGAVDQILPLSSKIWVGGEVQEFGAEWRQRVSEANNALARRGMRVIGVAFGDLASMPVGANLGEVEHNMTFVGMFALVDPPRPEAAAAVASCKQAGIRPVMITGDHPLTAHYIAESVGIPISAAPVTGAELDRTSDTDLRSAVAKTNVYARVAPAHKLRIVQALQQNGQLVAVTGDGVNDAPALKQADIGVAMGVTGTDVAKNAADMVLLDDNFATIVAAVEEGRVIYDNIRKFIKYILATNSGEIWTMLITPLLGMPLALLPVQILWMNLVTDGLPALALGVEAAEAGTMKRPAYPPQESIFARGMGRHTLWVGLVMGILSVSVGYGYWHAGRENWQTMLFTTLTLSQMAHVVGIRSEGNSIFQIGLGSNPALVAAVTLTIMLQVALVYVPFLQRTFTTVGLSAGDAGVAVLVSSGILALVEVEKWFGRRRR
jgi:Ca2+-transporting ATPase